jgi:hypothetical protein
VSLWTVEEVIKLRKKSGYVRAACLMASTGEVSPRVAVRILINADSIKAKLKNISAKAATAYLKR